MVHCPVDPYASANVPRSDKKQGITLARPFAQIPPSPPPRLPAPPNITSLCGESRTYPHAVSYNSYLTNNAAMKSHTKILLLILAGLVFFVYLAGKGGQSGAKPEIYSKSTFQEAQAQAAANGGLLIVKATATWCGPCIEMDQTTMQDPQVVQWMKDNATLVSLDIDEESTQARALRISSIPTMMAFKGSQEVSRTVGGQSSEEFLTWLKEVKAGTAAGVTTMQVK